MCDNMNIVLDLDNTLFDNNVVASLCEKAGVPQNKHWDLHDLPQEVQDACWVSFNDELLMCNLEPIPEALGIDKKLHDAGHTVTVVSARSKNLYESTKAMVMKHFPYVDAVVVVESWDKTETYKELKADLVADDHAAHIQQAIDVGVKFPILISNDTTLYNHEAKDTIADSGGYITSSVKNLEFFTNTKCVVV